MKPKSTTMAQRFGFADPDLTTPAHDALLMWLDEEIEAIARAQVGELKIDEQRISRRTSDYGATRSVAVDVGDLTTDELEILTHHPLGKPKFTITKTWECPILDKSYTIGFCDMMINIRRSCSNTYVRLGFEEPDVRDTEESLRWWLEIKPSIPSIGELVRQLRMYQSYTGGDKWFVVSPDTRYRTQIEGQGFGFIAVPTLAPEEVAA